VTVLELADSKFALAVAVAAFLSTTNPSCTLTKASDVSLAVADSLTVFAVASSAAMAASLDALAAASEALASPFFYPAMSTSLAALMVAAPASLDCSAARDSSLFLMARSALED